MNNRSKNRIIYFFLNKTAAQKKNLILVGFILMALVHAIFIVVGFYKHDDIGYARLAAIVAKNGQLNTHAIDHFDLRWTVIFVTAFFYKIFAINAFTSTLCAFISTCLSGILIKRITSNYKPFVFFLTLLFFFFAHSVLFYMHRILPDPTISMAALWMFASYKSSALDQRKPFGYALQFSLALMLAVISKETIIIVLPLFVLLFLIDVIKKQRLRFWVYAVSTSLLLIFLYLIYFKVTTGSFFYRYHILLAGNYFSICSFDQLPLSYTLARIGYELWKAMLLNGDLLLILPAFAALFYQKEIRSLLPVDKIDFTAFLVLLLGSNFMTISLTSYIPLCQDPRHFLFLFPFAAILSGPLLYLYNRDPWKFLLLPFSLFVATGVMFFLNAGTTKYLYLFFSLILVLPLISKWSSFFKYISSKAFFAGIIGLFLINYCIDIIKPRFPFYRSHEAIVNRVFKNREFAATIVSGDRYSHLTTEFFLDFEIGKFKLLPNIHAATAEDGNIYLLKVGDLNPALEVRLNQLFKENTAPAIYEVDHEGDVYLYKTNKELLMKLVAE